jgi:3-oxoacyl-[acyl-carrier protein] reductase
MMETGIGAGRKSANISCMLPSVNLFLNGKSPEAIERMSKAAPLERLGTPEEIAAAVSYLASPNSWVNGQTLRANGGLV